MCKYNKNNNNENKNFKLDVVLCVDLAVNLEIKSMFSTNRMLAELYC